MARVIIEFVDCNVRWTGHRFGCLENCRKSSRIVQAARSAEDIPGRCDVNKTCDWRIWQSISQIRSDLLVLDIRDAVEKYVVDNVYRIESLAGQQYDNLYGNGYSRVRTIFLNIHLFNTPYKRQRTNTSGIVSSL